MGTLNQRDVFQLKSSYCSSKGPEFSSQHIQQVAVSCITLSPRDLTPLASKGSPSTDTYTLLKIKKNTYQWINYNKKLHASCV